MELVFAISGFVGAWLLFAGPVYQASIELSEEQLDREEFERYNVESTMEPAPSAWWWLLPPVALAKRREWSTRQRARWMQAIPREQREKLFSFFNKSTGWILVGAGAFFIAGKESFELVEVLEWSLWALIPAILVPVVLSVAFVVARSRLTTQALADEDNGGAENDGPKPIP